MIVFSMVSFFFILRLRALLYGPKEHYSCTAVRCTRCTCLLRSAHNHYHNPGGEARCALACFEHGARCRWQGYL
jgi:hypothetical protein